MGLPTIEVVFKQLAVSAIKRSERGIAAIIIRDDTLSKTDITKKTYRSSMDLDSKSYTEANLKILERCFLVAVNKVVVISLPTEGDFKDALKVLDKIKYNYVCTTDAANQQALASYVVDYNATTKGMMKHTVCIVYDATTADSKYVINVKNATVTEIQTASDGTKSNVSVAMNEYLPRLCAILANLPMNRSCTSYVLEDLADCADVTTEDTDLDGWIDKGYFCLYVDDDEVKIARGVNSLTTFTSTDTEDMSHIIIVESMNLIIEDIATTFKQKYQGKYKNYLSNQKLFIDAVDAYFKELEKEEILDPDYTGNDDAGTTGNEAYIDVEAQRNAWLSVGKTAATDWTDDKVRSMAFKTTVFLAATVKILDAIEDLKFVITME